MITVEVCVPYLNSSFDFSLDENVSIALVTEEIVSLICIKEHWSNEVAEKKFNLHSVNFKKTLPETSTLFSEGICSGQQVILC